MKPASSCLHVLAVFLSLPALCVDSSRAAEPPTDTNAIERLTPEEAKRLVQGFRGVTAEFEIKGLVPSITMTHCLPLNGLKSLDAETAKELAGYRFGPLMLNGLTTLDADTAKALAACGRGPILLNRLTRLDVDAAKALTEVQAWDGNLPSFRHFDAPDSVAIAQALATRQGPLSLPNLQKISPHTLMALIEKQDVVIPFIETLELIPEPNGAPTEDFVIPAWLETRQRQQRAQRGQTR